ncbi:MULTISPECIES: L(+)-tartrate dehydratase subunit alpha [Enterobacteriaceae]|uniref:L(+)-tartrate dehydratase subunit alpha n=1 Tax=Enterobacteriaceae TaxID=543 RepID=UPI0009C5BC20|nr:MULTISPECIES: L(+)-tartrate dehydratase subunit alpha [Phytobacter]MBS6737739.1 L(+)-tartrate dehydratase subunit alpha [Enterobacteriaceae bacterium]SLJ98344.1 L(+)-tartrate dehydratase alpha subunit [Enterobacter sp. NFR05]MBV8872573.1 L(+)-tartrate dehydratase subunit alpha [Phytobacter sp.]MBY6258582.1 L(+)-tartrate dehydratase subunit alpha [Phytobacter diazotrophicus]MDU7134742.1 L(+)-tartrate dehydratase subunit alpha [Enterobacteriaceae bacterium]
MNTSDAMSSLTDVMTRFTGYVGKRLPTDVMKKLEALRAEEDAPLAVAVYDSMFENQKRADELDRPCCQDTGVIQYFITCGAKFPYLSGLQDALRTATLEATKKAPLRHNAVETFIEKNTGTNTGSRVPWLDWDIIPDDDSCTIEVYMAGGGCSLPGAAKVLMPGQGYEGVNQFVFDVITSYGVNACPPLLVGVGVSTSVETAARLSKKAILRPVDSAHPNADAAKMEVLLEEGLNKVGLGPQGLGGKATVMGVNIESSARHPSTIGVAVSTGCWAHRRGAIRFAADLSYEILSHEGAVL